MNNLAFQIYGSKKTGIFQSTWKTDNIGVYVELASSATASLNWSGTAFSSGYTHIAGVGNTTPLSTSISAISGKYYQIKYTVTGTTGSVTINYGGTSNIVSTYNSEVTITVLTTSTSSLSVLPTFDFNGNVKISLKQYVSSIATQVKLPLIGGNYNFWVDWGDGQYNNVTNANYTTSSLHNYSVAGTYTIRISGDIAGWNFGDTGDKLKILTIYSWGKLRLQGYGEYFKGCVNLSLSGLTDVLDLSTTTTLLSMFASCVNITTIPRINEWDTSKVTSMGSMFYVTNFDGDISNWNVSKVISFYDMFGGASKFNNGGSSGINNWLINTTSNVDMTRMFNGAGKFNQPLDLWNVTKVTSMSQMFQYCTIFNQSLNNWERTTIGNTSTLANVINMSNMFFAATAFNNGYASGVANQLTLNTSACTSMSGTFQGATAFNSNLGNGTTPWDVSKVTTFAGMFQSTSNFNNGDDTAPINNWNINTVSNVTMASMFNGASKFNRNIENWNVTKVTDMNYMFGSAIIFNQPLSNWERTGSTLVNVTNMNNMFNTAVVFNQPIGNWNTSNVTQMANMFSFAYVFNQEIGTWNMSKVTTISGMFYRAYLFDKPLAGWERSTPGDVSSLNKVTNMNSTFLDARVFNQPIGNWDTSSVTTMSGMFSRSSSVYGGPGANLFNQSIGNWNVSKVVNFVGMFYANAGAISFNNGDNSAPLDNWILNTSPSASIIMSYMFLGCPFNRYLGSWNTSRVTDMSTLFGSTPFNNGFASGVANELPWDTSACTNMNTMFQTASAFNSKLGNGTTPWNVSKVTTFSSMFYGATDFNNGLASGVAGTMSWNTINATNMTTMFYGATAFNQDIGLFNVSKVVSFAGMFWNCISYNNGDNINPINNWVLNTTVGANIDMSLMFRTQVAGTMQFNRQIDSWNVSEVTNMSNMFSRFFTAVTSFNQPLANWERVGSSLSKVTNMSEMFSGSKLNYPIGNWNTSGVTNMYAMFLDNIQFNQDISTWNVSKVINMQDMFYGATVFNNGLASGISGTFTWNINTASNVSMYRMFLGASAFNQNIGLWNVSQVTNLTNFMSTKTPSTYSSTNLDAIYNGWSTQTLQHTTPITISFGTAKYSSAGTAGRLTLTSSPNNWAITDGGQLP